MVELRALITVVVLLLWKVKQKIGELLLLEITSMVGKEYRQVNQMDYLDMSMDIIFRV